MKTSNNKLLQDLLAYVIEETIFAMNSVKLAKKFANYFLIALSFQKTYMINDPHLIQEGIKKIFWLNILIVEIKIFDN